jgi:hypothetical protein
MPLGISIDVEGFFHLPSGPAFEGQTSVRKAWLRRRSETLNLICAHFGWPSPPWGEPNEKAAPTSSSMQWASYDSLLALARFVTLQAADSAEIGRFRHCTLRYDMGYEAIYLPVEFPDPFLIERSEFPERCTVGSSVGLLSELTLLTTFLWEGSRAWAASREEWERARYAHATLIEFAMRSRELRLPMFLVW